MAEKVGVLEGEVGGVAGEVEDVVGGVAGKVGV